MNSQQPMGKSRKDDLNDILGEIRSGSARKPAAKVVRKGRSPEQRVYLVLALLVFAGGIGYVIYNNLKAPAPQTEAQELAPGVPADVNVVYPGGGYDGGGGGGGGAAVTRPESVMDLLPVPHEKFGVIASLKEANGPDYDAWILLRAPLDSYTEHLWSRAGILRNEGLVVSPYIRKVTVGSRASLNLLIDWHAELAARLPGENAD